VVLTCSVSAGKPALPSQRVPAGLQKEQILKVASFVWKPRPAPLHHVTVDAQTANFYEHYSADLALRYESAASPIERFFPLPEELTTRVAGKS
jgi:hypothetical protein